MHYNEEVTRAQRKEGFVLMGPSVLGSWRARTATPTPASLHQMIQFRCEYILEYRIEI